MSDHEQWLVGIMKEDQEVEDWMDAPARLVSINESHPKRRASFIAGRRLTKELFPKEKSAIISSTDEGEPYLANLDDYISISHSKQYVAAVRSKAPVGIDIQVYRPISPRMESKFLHSNDALPPNGINIHRSLQAWCVKESVFKATTLPIGNLTQVDMVKWQRDELDWTCRAQVTQGEVTEHFFVVCHCYPGFILAIAKRTK